MLATHLSLTILVLLQPIIEAAKLKPLSQTDKYTEKGGKDNTLENDNNNCYCYLLLSRSAEKEAADLNCPSKISRGLSPQKVEDSR